MDNNKLSLLFNAKIKAFEKLNENFLKCKVYILALGKNQNKSYFSEENVNKAYSTLQFVPVIGHLMQNENGNWYLGGHDMKLDIENGFKLKSQCVPFGVAIPTPEPVYEDVVEEDGTVAKYLTCEAVLWTGRYPELLDAVYSEDCYFSQSMEIIYSEAKPLEEDNTYMNIIDFSFDALCLLNKSDDPKFNVTPCFPSASVRPINYSLNSEEFSTLMNEFKQELSFCLNNKKDNEGGKNLNKKNEILKQYNKTIDDLDFSIDDLSDEEFESKMAELYGKNNEPVSFSATYRQKRQALDNALDPIIVRDDDENIVEETYFWISDFSDEYVFVEKSHWTQNDYECKYGRYSYTFDESTLTATITSEFEEMVLEWLTLDEKAALDAERANYEKIVAEYEEYKTNHTVPDNEVEELRNYKLNKEKEERKNILDGFSDIKETNEYKELIKNTDKFSLKELKKECIYIRGLYAEVKQNNNNEKDSSLKFSVEYEDDEENDVYGGVMKKYLRK